MRTACVLLLALLGLAATPDASRVLILVNDEVPPSAGTGRKGASVYAGEYYAEKRGVPKEHILHLRIPLACCQHDPLAWDSWHIRWDRFDETIRKPLLKYLSAHRLTGEIDYIVSAFGIPTTLVNTPSVQNGNGLSVDSFLASINSGAEAIGLRNPYHAKKATDMPPHFREWSNPAGWKMYLVTRLDGPSVAVATGLVDKAMRAEKHLKRKDGIAWFDYRHRPCCDAYYEADQGVMDAYVLSTAQGFKSMLNDQGKTKAMIHDAPETLWAWGWYSGPKTWEGYRFVEGAVGAQLTSYTATNIRGMMPGTWVPLWLNAGITATWGATGEPTVRGYARGENLLNHFWMGYNFAESSYIASPVLNHKMIFVGDPLYAPEIFRQRPAGR